MKTKKFKFDYWKDEFSDSTKSELEEYVSEFNEKNFYDMLKGGPADTVESKSDTTLILDPNEIDIADYVLDDDGTPDNNGRAIIPAYRDYGGRFRGYYRIYPDGTITKYEARLKRKGKYSDFYKGAPLKFGVDAESGRATVILQSHSDNHPLIHFIDELLATAYIRRPLNRCEYLVHKDGDPTNISLDNLVWTNYIYEASKLWWYTFMFRDKNWNVPKCLNPGDYISVEDLKNKYNNTPTIIPDYHSQTTDVGLKVKSMKLEPIVAFDEKTKQPLKMFSCIDDAVSWMIDRDKTLGLLPKSLDISLKSVRRSYNDIIRASMSTQSVQGMRYLYNLYIKSQKFQSRYSKQDKIRTSFIFENVDFSTVSRISKIARNTLSPMELYSLKPKAWNGVIFSIWFPGQGLSLDSAIFVYNKLYNTNNKYEQK